MQILFLVFVFLSCFLLLISFGGSKVKAGEQQERLTFLEGLKQSNEVLKKLLVRKQKPSVKRNSLEDLLSSAGIPMRSEEFTVLRWLFTIIAGGAIHLLTKNLLLAIIGLVLGFFVPMIWVKNKRRKRIIAFNEGLPNMISSLVGSLRAGFSFLQSLQMVAEESYSPIKEEVDYLLRLMQYGTSMENALQEWTRRMPSEDLNLLVDAILIQRQVGGNLAYLLDKIVETMRERTRIENQIRTLTAQGRLSGLIISLLPVGLGLIIFVMNPTHVKTLFVHPIGQGMLVLAVIGGVLGFFFVRKITTIEV